MEIKDLVGRKKLDAVSFSDSTDRFGDASFVKFRLDDVVYCALEDEEDDYRSSLRELIVLDHDDIDNVFPSIDVDCIMKDDEDQYILTLYDVITSKIVLEVGTNYVDEYYPSFVGAFFPEAICINQGVA